MPKAMILAAGMGTRLMPLTDSLPKALVPLAGKPLIEHVLNRFRIFGISEVIINLHHRGGQLRNFLESERFSDFHFAFSDESDKLLDTGGGLRKAAWFFNDGRPFLVHNCDVISRIPLNIMLQSHYRRKAMATLAVSKRETSRPLAFTRGGMLAGRYDITGSTDAVPMAYSGICILDPAVFNFMPSEDVFSIIDVLTSSSKSGIVAAFEHSPEIWADAGSIQNFEKAEGLLENSHL